MLYTPGINPPRMEHQKPERPISSEPALPLSLERVACMYETTSAPVFQLIESSVTYEPGKITFSYNYRTIQYDTPNAQDKPQRRRWRWAP